MRAAALKHNKHKIIINKDLGIPGKPDVPCIVSIYVYGYISPWFTGVI